jgi:hypothetical protein
MPNPVGSAIDLKAASEKLNESYPKVSGLIRQLSSAHSIRSDLGMALDMLGALDKVLVVASELGEKWASDTALALINSTVVFYVRATKTHSHHRGSIAFDKEFTSDEQEIHNKLVRLRDDAIAHFGPGEEYGGPTWQREGVFLPIDQPDDMRVMTVSRRIIMQKELQMRMKKQIHRALLIAEKITQQRNSRLIEHMNDIAGDIAFSEILNQHLINLTDFFETDEARDHAIGGLRRGRRSGVVEY